MDDITLSGGGFEVLWSLLQSTERFMTEAQILEALGPEGPRLWADARRDPRFPGSVVRQGREGQQRYQTFAQAAARIAHMLRVTGRSLTRAEIGERLQLEARDDVWENIVRRLRFHDEIAIEATGEGEARYAAQLAPDTLFDPRFHPQSARSATELAGSMLAGRYEVLKELGRGGFGVVYKARQMNLGTPVAIKVMLTQQMVSPEVLEGVIARFEQEMWLLASLNHPNIVKLYDAGQLPDGDLYTVLEFIDGVPLEDLLERGPLAPREAFRLMRQVANVLHHAHRGGVIHRDLKPANVMVTDPGPYCNAMVLDFGIACLHLPEGEDAPSTAELEALSGGEGEAGEASRITRAGQVIGTPHYMAPEQIRGASTPAIDIYAWGLVFIEALTGRPVYRGSLAAIFREKLEGSPPPAPSVIEGTPLAEVIARAVASDPAERYADAAELLADLAAIDPRALEEAREEPTPMTSVSAPRSPRSVAWLLLALALALALLLDLLVLRPVF